MKNFLKLTLFALILGGASNFYAASNLGTAGYETFFAAIRAQDVNAVRAFIQKGINVNDESTFNNRPRPALFVAVAVKSPEIVGILLGAGATPNPLYQFNNPLCAAYNMMNSTPLWPEDRDKLQKIITSLIYAGGSCDNEHIYFSTNFELANFVKKIRIENQTEKAMEQAQESLSESGLSGLPRSIIRAYVTGISPKEQPSETEEAVATIQEAPAPTEPGIKGLDED